MGKKGSSTRKKGPMVPVSSHPRMKQAASITLREESSGKQQKPLSVKSMLKFDHSKNLAIWAGVVAPIPLLSAFFGHRLAATAEALDVPQDPSLFSCQRCESILQPGHNCTVRIHKNKAKVRQRRKKSNFCMKNSVIYRCHVCSHQNLKRGTPQGYMKELCPPKIKLTDGSNPMKITIQMDSKPAIATESRDGIVKMDAITPGIEEDAHSIHAPATIGTTLLDSKRRKRSRPGAKKAAESGISSVVENAENSTGPSSKRKRKPWTSLKEIAERNEQEHRHGFSKLAIPFLL